MRYEAPDTIDAAVKLLASEAGLARVLAGGTDLLVQMRSDVVSPDLLVDIKKISEVRQVTEEGGGFRIGAAVTGAELRMGGVFAEENQAGALGEYGFWAVRRVAIPGS